MKPASASAFFSAAKDKHGDAYDLSEVQFVNNSTPVTVVCPTHGEFQAIPRHFIRGRGCPGCRISKTVATKAAAHDKAWFVTECRKTHGDKYDYSNTVFVNTRQPVNVTCREHGEFVQQAWVHKAGQGCPVCGTRRAATACAYTHAEWAERAAEVHGGRYTYPDASWESAKSKVEIVCPTHGSFWQEATSHLQGRGCPSCAKATLSQPEWDIVTLVKTHGVKAQHGYRPDWMLGKELDVFIPSHNLAIEYCGSWVHNSTKSPFGEPKPKNYHYDKWKLCRDNGVTLLTIYDFEWLSNREKWEAVIKHKLQKASRRVFARKCQIVPVERAVAYQFCKDHHIEGAGGAWTYQAECRGLEHDGELVAVMVLDKGDIKRSCTLSGVAVVGGVSKLFKSFPAGTTMMTTNNTGSSGNYGTRLDKVTLRYWWVKPGTLPKAIPRRQCQKHLLEARFGEPLDGRTEREYMESLGYVRCYDSGLTYWRNS